MEKILHDFYFGKILPYERRNKENNEQLDLIRKIGIEEKYFSNRLGQEDKIRFDMLSKLHDDLSETEVLETFTYAVRLGASLMLALIGEREVA